MRKFLVFLVVLLSFVGLLTTACHDRNSALPAEKYIWDIEFLGADLIDSDNFVFSISVGIERRGTLSQSSVPAEDETAVHFGTTVGTFENGQPEATYLTEGGRADAILTVGSPASVAISVQVEDTEVVIALDLP